MPRPGAVRAGGQRAGQRLGVDVTEVGQRQAADVQLAAQAMEGDAGLDPHEAARRVGVEHAIHALEREQRPAREHAAGERVPGTRHAHGAGARSSTALSSARDAGRSNTAGSHCWVRAQLTHAATR